MSAINHETMLGLDGGSRRYSSIPDIPSIPDPPQHKQVECDKNSELEKIKRQLYNAIDRIDKLKDK